MSDDSPQVYAFTEDEIQELIREVSKASYHAARYRGQFFTGQLEPVQQKMVERKADEWWEQNKEHY